MGKLVEAQRLEQRTRFDLEMLQRGRPLQGHRELHPAPVGRAAGRAAVDADRLPAQGLADVPGREPPADRPARRMYNGDRARKTTLVEYGFRLPTALDNRPLKFEEFEARMRQVVFVSATPADYEKEHAGQVVEQLVRPTGLVDPRGRGAPGHAPGRRRAAGDPHPRRQARARADHHADQAHGRAADRLPDRQRRQGALPAQRHRHRRAGRDPARPAAGRLRRAGGHQPAARGAGHPRGVAGGDPGRRQGRLPARRALADPDHRPGGAQPERPGHPVRRRDDRVDEEGDRRDRAAPRTGRSRTTWRTASRRAASGSRCAT